MSYSDHISENRETESTFTSNKYGEIVTIKTRKGSITTPGLDLPEVTQNKLGKEKIGRPENEPKYVIENFIKNKYDENFELDLLHNTKALELINRVDKSSINNIKFKPINEKINEYRKEQVVIKRVKGVLQYNNADTAKKAVDQFKKLIDDIGIEQRDRDETIERMPMFDLEWDDEFDKNRPEVIPGLTPKEITGMRGVLFPSETIETSKRIGPKGMLQIQIDHVSETIGYTERELDRTSDPELRQALEERIYGLNEAGELTTRQKILEETRYEQEEDITRLKRFKRWAKENLLGISALAISVAGIITTIVIGPRKALIKGAQATGKFAKAVYNLGKKLGALLAPILNVIVQASTWGAKGLAFLANNLWLLALAVAWFIYDQYKQRRRK